MVWQRGLALACPVSCVHEGAAVPHCDIHIQFNYQPVNRIGLECRGVCGGGGGAHLLRRHASPGQLSAICLHLVNHVLTHHTICFWRPAPSSQAAPSYLPPRASRWRLRCPTTGWEVVCLTSQKGADPTWGMWPGLLWLCRPGTRISAHRCRHWTAAPVTWQNCSIRFDFIVIMLCLSVCTGQRVFMPAKVQAINEI